jgi:tripartite ATP-independent transporter DctP family solute receptor
MRSLNVETANLGFVDNNEAGGIPMRKVVILLLVVTLLAPAVFGKGAGEKQVLRWGSVMADTTIQHKMALRIAGEVNSKAGGRLEIQTFGNSVLGSSRDLVEGVQAGIIDMITDGPGYFANAIPITSILDAPYTWKDMAHMDKALNGSPFGGELNAEFLKNNVRILGALYYGTRHLTTTKTEVHSVKDMAGLKIRVPELMAFMEMINSWGGKATPIPLGDLYLSLQTNVVDGQENPLPTFNANKFYEVQKYVILTKHLINPNFIFINEGVFQKLSPEDQKILLDAVRSGIEWNNSEMVKSEAQLQTELTARGIIFITPDAESFRNATIPVLLPKFESAWGKGTWDRLQKIN